MCTEGRICRKHRIVFPRPTSGSCFPILRELHPLLLVIYKQEIWFSYVAYTENWNWINKSLKNIKGLGRQPKLLPEPRLRAPLCRCSWLWERMLTSGNGHWQHQQDGICRETRDVSRSLQHPTPHWSYFLSPRVGHLKSSLTDAIGKVDKFICLVLFAFLQ